MRTIHLFQLNAHFFLHSYSIVSFVFRLFFVHNCWAVRAIRSVYREHEEALSVVSFDQISLKKGHRHNVM